MEDGVGVGVLVGLAVGLGLIFGDIFIEDFLVKGDSLFELHYGEEGVLLNGVVPDGLEGVQDCSGVEQLYLLVGESDGL